MAREPSPQEQERLRRLLLDARHTEPVPDAVAVRLDATLADLEQERADAPIGEARPRRAAVLELTAQRRRRAAGLLIAAAAVVVVGVGLGQVLPTGSSGGDSATSAALEDAESLDGGGAEGGADTSAQRSIDEDTTDSADELEPLELGASESDESSAFSQATGPREFLVLDSRRLVKVDEDDFSRTATRVQRLVARGVRPTNGRSGEFDSLERSGAQVQQAFQGCAPADWGTGDLVAVEYQGQPAVLALRPARGDTQVADLLQCGTAGVLRSVTLTVR